MAVGIEGKVVLVTGGASGIGSGTAKAFGLAGARVAIITGSNRIGAEETVNQIKSAGGEAFFILCDVTNEKAVEDMVEKVVETYGSLDFAFNNAGIGPDGRRVPIVNIVDCPEEIWDQTIDVNLKGTFLCMKHEIRQMLRQGKGSIVNTSSSANFKPSHGFCAYVASKSGLIGLSKVAALEYAKNGVRVNVICPGPTAHTQLMDNLSKAKPGEIEHVLSKIPMHRLGEPIDIAEAVLWFCSDAASFITGQVLSVDGGLTTT